MSRLPLQTLDTAPEASRAFIARDLVDDRFVREAITKVGGPRVFGLPDDLLRQETIVV